MEQDLPRDRSRKQSDLVWLLRQPKQRGLKTEQDLHTQREESGEGDLLHGVLIMAEVPAAQHRDVQQVSEHAH